MAASNEQNRDMPLLLVYQRMWGGPLGAERNALLPHWEFTEDRSRLAEADVVVFHLPDLDVLTFARLRKRPGQYWVGWTMEASAHHPQQRAEVVQRRLDLSMDHRLTSDVPVPYVLRFASELTRRPLPIPSTRPGTIAAFISSPANASGRIEYLSALMRHVPVDSYGFVLNTVLDRGGDDGSPLAKQRVLADHRYAIAFENACEDGYVTEKIYDALLAGAIPIYLGAAIPEELLPARDCYVDASSRSPAELAAELARIDQDPAALAALHAWRTLPLPPGLPKLAARLAEHPFTRLCRVADERFGSGC